jgi:Omp85 superfamily domain
VLALRAGGRMAWGDYPFHQAAFLGGWGSLRGYDHDRFAGDGAVFGGAELRVPLLPLELVVRGRLGISVLADAGRVIHDGESPGGWHTATGAGLWFATPPAVVTLHAAKTPECTRASGCRFEDADGGSPSAAPIQRGGDPPRLAPCPTCCGVPHRGAAGRIATG